MSYGYYCQECHKIKFDGVPRLWHGKTVCRSCYEKLDKEEQEKDTKRKEKNGIQKTI